MRMYVTAAELQAKLNSALVADDRCADCQFTPIVRHISPPKPDGLNWSPASLKVRCSGSSAEVCGPHATAILERFSQDFSLRHDDGWLYDLCFTYKGRQFLALHEAVGVSTSGPAIPSNARWVVSVDGGTWKFAFDSSPNDNDPQVLKARIIVWHQTTHGA